MREQCFQHGHEHMVVQVQTLVFPQQVVMAAKGNPGLASFGGVFRNYRGAWELGYMGKIGNNTNLAAKL
ncbi:hypothetical protein Scep_004733 [Stephania cephalantha]|uniref:Uncharacterized protein n=1 Tax=Stephania cephalantha TaxID=152367 RepID=A0AAP0KVW5_9MAGN